MNVVLYWLFDMFKKGPERLAVGRSASQSFGNAIALKESGEWAVQSRGDRMTNVSAKVLLFEESIVLSSAYPHPPALDLLPSSSSSSLACPASRLLYGMTGLFLLAMI